MSGGVWCLKRLRRCMRILIILFRGQFYSFLGSTSMNISFSELTSSRKGRGRTLSLTVRDIEVALARVRSVGASIVLDGAASLECGASVDEGVTVDAKRSVAGSVAGDGRCSTTQRASEGLNVGAARILATSQFGSRNGGSNLCLGGVRLEEVLAENATRGVIGVVTGVALASVVTCL